jgi:hypothetical protein
MVVSDNSERVNGSGVAIITSEWMIVSDNSERVMVVSDNSERVNERW